MIRRKVTHIIKNQFGDIVGLSNPSDQWSKTLEEAYSEISSARYYYYINTGQNAVKITGKKDYLNNIELFSDPLLSKENLLESLPCHITVGV